MTEVLFYHLRNRPLDKVLPGLLERSLARGWRCAVEAGEERIRALDDLLWTYADDSFLPHGVEADDGAHQPVVLVTHPGNPNGAVVRFLLEGAPFPADLAGYERVVVLFDGQDEDAVATARERWREAKGGGHAATYWIEDEAGRWVKRG
jgi:DNA polymerase-3 subunit chi